MKKKAFVNGKIFTSDREKPYAESFIAEDGYIMWIGNRIHARQRIRICGSG